MSVNMHYNTKYSRIDEYTHSRINHMVIMTVYNSYKWAYNPVAETTVEIDAEYLRYACYWLTYRSMTASELVQLTMLGAKYYK